MVLYYKAESSSVLCDANTHMYVGATTRPKFSVRFTYICSKDFLILKHGMNVR